jgi:periplasmic protein CpxP/Spy
MNKKMIAITLALALPLSVAAFAGEKCAFEGRHANRVERLTKSLDLNAEQKTKLAAIFKEQEAKFKAVHDETRTRLQSVLTKEQLAKMDDMKKQRLEKWQKKHEALKDQKTPDLMK